MQGDKPHTCVAPLLSMRRDLYYQLIYITFCSIIYVFWSAEMYPETSSAQIWQVTPKKELEVTWSDVRRFFIGTPPRLLLTIVVSAILIFTGVVQFFLEAFIAAVLVPLLIIFLLLAVMRYALFGRGSGHKGK